jgi:SOS-response transcriptional repressor LexA
MNIEDIIKRVNEIYGFKTKADLARWFEVPAATLHDRINNAKNNSKHKEKSFGNKIYEDILVHIAKDDRINPNYIFFGKPPKFFDEKTVRKIKGEEIPLMKEDNEVFTVPYYTNIKASTNAEYYKGSDCEPEYLIMPKTLCKTKTKYIHAIKVDDDSMSPNIKGNSIVFVDTGNTFLAQNRVFVVNYRGDIYVKRIQQVDGHILLKSDNIHYNTIVCEPQDLKIVGKVINSISVDNLE